MLARVLVMVPCLCLSVTSRCSIIEMDGQIVRSSWVLACIGFFRPILQNKGSSLLTLSQTPELQNFASAYRSPKRLIDLGRERWTPERDKLDRRPSTKLTIPPSSESRPLQLITCDRQALSTARHSRAGQLATADTCLMSGASTPYKRWSKCTMKK